jgi:hypothetical protein
MAKGFSDDYTMDESVNMPISEMEKELDRRFKDSLASPLRDRATEKGNNMRVPGPGQDIDALGQVYNLPPKKVINILKEPKINPNYNRNTGYGLKGDIFPRSAAQRAEYDKMYGGTGSANAQAMEALRQMGREGMVAKRARERYETSPAGRTPPERPNYTLRQILGK